MFERPFSFESISTGREAGEREEEERGVMH